MFWGPPKCANCNFKARLKAWFKNVLKRKSTSLACAEMHFKKVCQKEFELVLTVLTGKKMDSLYLNMSRSFILIEISIQSRELEKTLLCPKVIQDFGKKILVNKYFFCKFGLFFSQTLPNVGSYQFERVKVAFLLLHKD